MMYVVVVVIYFLNINLHVMYFVIVVIYFLNVNLHVMYFVVVVMYFLNINLHVMMYFVVVVIYFWNVNLYLIICRRLFSRPTWLASQVLLVFFLGLFAWAEKKKMLLVSTVLIGRAAIFLFPFSFFRYSFVLPRFFSSAGETWAGGWWRSQR